MLQALIEKTMSHGKAFLMGATGTVQGRLGWASDTVRDIFHEYEPVLTESDWLRGQDFSCVHYVVRFGGERVEKIETRKLKKYNELSVASQLSMTDLHDVFLDRQKLREFIENEVIRVLRHVKDKYGLPSVPELGI